MMPKKIVCPECYAEFESPDDVMLREILTCPECGLEVEVTKIEENSVECRKISIEKEDWGE
jgi:alpha-aminoadipate carrier protein LysW